MDATVTGMSSLGKSFLSASNRCQVPVKIKDNEFEIPLIPSIVCIAFATELYLKAVLTIENNLVKSHELKKLFNALFKDTKDSIIQNLKLTVTVFEMKLDEANNAFVEWRYVYEPKRKNVDIDFLRKLVSELAKIVDLKNK